MAFTHPSCLSSVCPSLGTLRKQSSGSLECTHQSRDPEGCTYQSSDPEGYTYQSSDPEGYTDQSSDPERCIYQSSDPEGCIYQSSDPEGCTYQSSDHEGYTYPLVVGGLANGAALLQRGGRPTEETPDGGNEWIVAAVALAGYEVEIWKGRRQNRMEAKVLAARRRRQKSLLLEVKDLTAVIAETKQEILKGVNLVVYEGEVHAIMGKNGSGKSTFAKVVQVGLEVVECAYVIELDGLKWAEAIESLDDRVLGSDKIFDMKQRPDDWDSILMDLEVTVQYVVIIGLDVDHGVWTGKDSESGFGCTRLICASFGSTRLICASFGSTRLMCASFGSTRLICATFGSTRLICASFGSTGLICAFYETTRLLCRAPPNRKLTVVRARLGADRRGAERMHEGHMDVSDFIFASADVFWEGDTSAGKGKAFNNTRVKRSIKVPTISNKLADMMIIYRGNMTKSQSRLLHTQGLQALRCSGARPALPSSLS
ncbi:ABC transporter I family member 6 [Cucumis melo var. makuwa]|uniref:ABC transporter I family member 6 n=1 Tax=Cucumis melo var. makuwa TaxID=1194695 RepID=A0A5A7VDI7_CUCMM|nr:ABC transporter I family member 6 [Cucumis melo var. makuwa]